MKILFFTELTHVGGVDSFLINLLEYWPNHEDELIVMTNASHPGLEALAERLRGRVQVSSHGVPSYVDCVVQRELLQRRCNPVSAFARRLLLALRGGIEFRRLFQQIDPDRLIIVAGGYPGGDSCRIATLAWRSVAMGRPKAIYNFHGLVPRANEWNFVVSALDALVVRSVSAFVAVSGVCAESLRRRSRRWKKVPVEYIHNGIMAPPKEEGDPSVRVELGLEPDCLLVLMLATYERNKGHDLLLNALARVHQMLPTVRLVICGFGYENEVRYVEQAIAARGLTSVVTLMGFRRDVHRFLAAADILVVPTQTYESFGLVAAEAMSVGVPVIATRVGGLPEVVSHSQGGYLVEPDDAQGLALYMMRLLSDKTLRKHQGQLGKERYLRHFTASRMAKEYAIRISRG